MKISFWAQGVPKGQPRPRAFARKMGNKVVARVYDAGTAEGWKSCIATAALTHVPKEPIGGPVSLDIVLVMPRPKGHYGTGKNATLLKQNAPDWHVGKPDTDNAAKAILDCLTTMRFWRDDAQVVQLNVSKVYETNSGPGAAIEIEELTGATA